MSTVTEMRENRGKDDATPTPTGATDAASTATVRKKPIIGLLQVAGVIALTALAFVYSRAPVDATAQLDAQSTGPSANPSTGAKNLDIGWQTRAVSLCPQTGRIIPTGGYCINRVCRCPKLCDVNTAGFRQSGFNLAGAKKWRRILRRRDPCDTGKT